MHVYLHTKFQVSRIILTSFRQVGIPSLSPLSKRTSKNPTQISFKDFYPRKKKILLINAINLAEKSINITNEDTGIIKHARKSFLCDNNKSQMKNDSGLLDVTMSACNGQEVCEMVGTFSFYKFSLKYNKNNIGIYRDDDLAIFKNISDPE